MVMVWIDKHACENCERFVMVYINQIEGIFVIDWRLFCNEISLTAAKILVCNH